MATWFPRTRTTVTREWVVPVPNDHAQLLQAIHAAKVDRLISLGLLPDAFGELYDNHVMVRVADDEIILFYEMPAKDGQ